MVTETTVSDEAPGEDPREVRQEYRQGTIDTDVNGDGTITVSLTGEFHALGLGLHAVASSSTGTASTANLTASSVDVSISGGTASSTESFEVVVSEDGFYRASGGV